MFLKQCRLKTPFSEEEDEGELAKHGYARLLHPLPNPWFIVLRTKQNGGLCLPLEEFKKNSQMFGRSTERPVLDLPSSTSKIR
jgi:hypothetical protein